MTRITFFLTFLLVPISLIALSDQVAVAQSISIANGPTVLQPGGSYDVTVNYSSSEPGIVQLQIFDPSGTWIDGDWTTINAGSGSDQFTINIPSNAVEDVGYYWQAIVYDVDWGGVEQKFIYDVAVVGSVSEPTIQFAPAPPVTLAQGQTLTVDVDFELTENGFVQVQLLNSQWQSQANDWTSVTAGQTSARLSVTVPANLPASNNYRWQAIVYDTGWNNNAQQIINNVAVTASSAEPTIAFSPSPPTTLAQGQTLTVDVDFELTEIGFVQVQLVNSQWQSQANDWTIVTAGQTNATLSVTVPANLPAGNNYRWQAIVYDIFWDNKAQQIINDVTVGSSGGGAGQFLPALASGSWNPVPDWADEFAGNGIGGTNEPTNWYAHMGSGWWSYQNTNEKGLRWSGGTPDSAWMFSTKFANTLSDGKGTYYLDGSGHLVLRAAVDKRDTLNNGSFGNAGPKVECAYLQTGRPVNPNSVSGYPLPTYPGNNGSYTLDPWAGKFVEPGSNGIYLSCRAKMNKLGHSTWFAFWAHTHTQAYENKTANAVNNPNQSVFNSSTGTEIDIVEIWGSKQPYVLDAFSNNNHWKDGFGENAGSVGVRYDNGGTSTTESLQATGLTVEDGNWHEFGVHWKPNELVYYVDGQETFRTQSNVPSNPRDMMILLTLEFQVDKWEGNQGDGRTTTDSSGYVSDNSTLRVLSEVEVDWVRVHKMQ